MSYSHPSLASADKKAQPLQKLLTHLKSPQSAVLVKYPSIWRSWGVLKRELARIRRIWIQALLSPVLFNLLIALAFWQMRPESTLFSGSTLSKAQQIRALLAAYTTTSLIQHASGNVMSSLFPTKYHGALETLLVSATPRWGIILGYAGGGIFKSLLVQLLLLPLIAFFAPLNIEAWGSLLALLTLCACCFSLLGMMIALLAHSFDELSFISTFLILPATFLSGGFFALTALPRPLTMILQFNPFRIVIRAVQEAWIGSIGVQPPVHLPLLYLVMLTSIGALFWINGELLRRGYGNQFR